MNSKAENLIKLIKIEENPSIREIHTAKLAEICLQICDEMTKKISPYEEEK